MDALLYQDQELKPLVMLHCHLLDQQDVLYLSDLMVPLDGIVHPLDYTEKWAKVYC